MSLRPSHLNEDPLAGPGTSGQGRGGPEPEAGAATADSILQRRIPSYEVLWWQADWFAEWERTARHER